MDDALRTDIHVAAGRHLTILRHAEGIHAFPVIGLGVVGDDHAVGDHHAGCILVRGEQTQRVAAVHDKRLFVGHLAQIFHHQAILCPVLEHGPVAAVGNQLMGMLCHTRVEVVLDHHHDGGSLGGAVRIFVDGTGIHGVCGPEPVHVDASITFQLFGKLRSQSGMKMLGEIAQRISQGQSLQFGGEDVLALWCMVDVRVIRLCFRQGFRYSLTNIFNELFVCHQSMQLELSILRENLTSFKFMVGFFSQLFRGCYVLPRWLVK